MGPFARSQPAKATGLQITTSNHRQEDPTGIRTHWTADQRPTRLQDEVLQTTSESLPLLEDILADSANIFRKVFHSSTRRLFAEYFNGYSTQLLLVTSSLLKQVHSTRLLLPTFPLKKADIPRLYWHLLVRHIRP